MTERWYRRPVVVATVLVAAVLVVYGRVLGFDFVDWDDPTYVTENPAVRAGLTWPGVVWAFTTYHAGNWHPLTWLSHMLDQTMFGAWAGGHHLTSLLLHAVNTGLVFELFRRTTGATGRSAVVAGLFGLHPLHVESVAWVSERKDVLSTCAALLALHAYVGWVGSRRALLYALTLGAFALACLAKPMVVTLPGIMLLLDWWPLRRFELIENGRRGDASRAARRRDAVEAKPPLGLRALIVEKLPLVAVAVLLSVVTLAAQVRGGAVAEAAALPLAARIGNATISYIAYLGTMLWPVGLAFFYPYRLEAGIWMPTVATVALMAVTVLALRAARAAPYAVVGWCWYLGTLVPVIGLVQAGDQAMADRFTYLPLVGIFVIVAWGAVDLAARWRLPAWSLGIAAGAALAGCAGLTYRQAATWRASVPLFEHALAVTDGNYVAHNLLGFTLYADRRFGDAERHFAAAIAERPTMHEAHSNLGLALAAQGRFADAIPHYRDALRIRPEYATAEFNLAIALVATGARDEADRHAARALQLARQQGDGALAAQIAQWSGRRS